MGIERKWDNAVHFKPPQFAKFWTERLTQQRDLLIIVGLGWDPRMTALTAALKQFRGEGLRHFHLINYKPFPSFMSPYQVNIDRNRQVLDELTENWADLREVRIDTRREGNLYIGDEQISRFYKDLDISPYSDILVDVSSLPKSLYFTLLLILTKKCDHTNGQKNLHVIACQNVDLDRQITETADDTRLLKGFKGKLERHGAQDIPVIWAPLLARNSSVALERLFYKIDPTDIYPVLPFPGRNPREDDDLLIEYRDVFRSLWRLNPMNMIYAAEDDPLNVYRGLLNLFQKQKEALHPLGGVLVVVSALSSKLSSIGAFMAAFDGSMSVAHAVGRHDPPQDFDFRFWESSQLSQFKANLHSVWLTGEPYES